MPYASCFVGTHVDASYPPAPGTGFPAPSVRLTFVVAAPWSYAIVMPAGTLVAPFAGEVMCGPLAAVLLGPDELPGPPQVADGEEEHAASANTPANARGAMTRPNLARVVRIHPWCPRLAARQTSPYPWHLVVTDISLIGRADRTPGGGLDQNDDTYVLGTVTVTGTALPLMKSAQDRSHAVQPLPSATCRGVPLMLTGSPTMLFW